MIIFRMALATGVMEKYLRQEKEIVLRIVIRKLLGIIPLCNIETIQDQNLWKGATLK